MARSALLLTLVRAGATGDQPLFRTTVEALVADDRGTRHDVLADRLAQFLHSPVSAPHHGLNGTVNGHVKPSDLGFEETPQRGFDDLILPGPVARAYRESVEEPQRAELLRSYNLAPAASHPFLLFPHVRRRQTHGARPGATARSSSGVAPTRPPARGPTPA